ncbi:Hypothetical predicted protein [Podarcis lilfordi]|uniref:Uncharacterized protein n=1 Tax=Podarcis lilfordi TaxID=74358 RepID=A0AA35LEF4_9SAUR|nr:Hypothetical predicted protein [Podarcis lilfordi]
MEIKLFVPLSPVRRPSPPPKEIKRDGRNLSRYSGCQNSQRGGRRRKMRAHARPSIATPQPVVVRRRRKSGCREAGVAVARVGVAAQVRPRPHMPPCLPPNRSSHCLWRSGSGSASPSEWRIRFRALLAEGTEGGAASAASAGGKVALGPGPSSLRRTRHVRRTPNAPSGNVLGFSPSQVQQQPCEAD